MRIPPGVRILIICSERADHLNKSPTNFRNRPWRQNGYGHRFAKISSVPTQKPIYRSARGHAAQAALSNK